MSENSEMIIPPQIPKAGGNKNLLQGLVNNIKSSLNLRKEQKRVLSENEAAHERMSELGIRLRTLLDSQEWRGQEKRFESGYPNAPGTWIGYRSYIDPTEKGYGYSITVERDSRTAKAHKLEIYTRPKVNSGISNSSGADEGYWRIYFHDKYGNTPSKTNQKPKITISEFVANGDLYLGKDSGIKEINISDGWTIVDLPSVSYGGASAYVDMWSWGTDPNTQERVGPIGPIREIHVLGLARAKSPVSIDHTQDSQSTRFKVDETDFVGEGINIFLPQGEMDFGIKKEIDASGKEFFHIVYAGDRLKLKGWTTDGTRPIENLGRQTTVFTLPVDFIKGGKIIDLMDRCITNLETAFAKRDKPKLSG